MPDNINTSGYYSRFYSSNPNLNFKADYNIAKNYKGFGDYYKTNYTANNVSNSVQNNNTDYSKIASAFSGGGGGVSFGAIRDMANSIVGGSLNKKYSNLKGSYAQGTKDLFDSTQDPIMRAIKNWSGTSRQNIVSSIRNNKVDDSLFDFTINGSDNASLLNNFQYDTHSDEELGIEKNIAQRSPLGNVMDVINAGGVGTLNGFEYSGGNWIGGLVGTILGLGTGINNVLYDRNNTRLFNSEINQQNQLKRMKESAYRNNYLTQYTDQVNSVATDNYRNNMRNYYGILRDGGSIHIKPENRGKFTALKERTGHSATWFKENGTPAQRKMATFALNARHWNHSKADGGDLQDQLNKPLTDEQYFKIMERVANENYTDWGYDSPEAALLHAINDNTYNYRQFYNDNPEAQNNAKTHWPDTYKTVYHPTFSNESMYSGIRDKNYNPNGRLGGVWARDTFYPNYWQTQYRNGGELGTMDDINNGFIDITEGGTHEQNPLGGIPVNIAEDGLPNLVEEGEMIYNGYVYSNNLRPSKEAKQRLGLKGSTYADVIRKAQKYSSERPDDPVAKEYDKYIATTLAVEQEQQKANQDMDKTNKKGIRGHYADKGKWLHEATMAAPIWMSALQYGSDLAGFTNQYDYSELEDFRRNTGNLQGPSLIGYNSVGQHLNYNPMDSDYLANKAANQIAANRSMLRYASPTGAALQRNLMGLNYTGIASLSDALMKNKQYNDSLKKEVIGFNNALDLQNAGNKLNAAQFNAQAINRYREALADRNLRIAGSLAQLRSEIDNSISNARNINRDTFASNLGDWGKESKIYDMIGNDPYLKYAYINRGTGGIGYKGRCGGSIRRRK